MIYIIKRRRYKCRLLHLLFLFALYSCNNDAKQVHDTRTVYICMSATAYSYHLIQDCPGLNKCSHKIERSTVEIAKKRGRKFCGWETNDTLPSR